MLNDQLIRIALIQKLSSFSKRRQIIEELHVHSGRAIADVVALDDEPHCFEIKSDLDKIERITEQGTFYNLVFRKITLVTTRKHFEKAISLAPIHWGVIIAEEKEDHLSFVEVRPARINPLFDKTKALLTLWKNEMLELGKLENTKLNKKLLAVEIAKQKNEKELNKDISFLLRKRIKYNLSACNLCEH